MQSCEGLGVNNGTITKYFNDNFWSNTSFNPTTSIHNIIGTVSRVVLPTSFCLDGQTIPAMEWEDRYKHLGVLIGSDSETYLEKLAEEFRDNTEKLFQSALANWMKLEAFKEFVVPKLDYAL